MGEDVTGGPRALPRRGVIAAMAGGSLLAATEARAQGCAPPRAAREKGPRVWLDMDQKELDDAYTNSVYALNSREMIQKMKAANKVALAALGPPERHAYGSAPIEGVDLWRTKAPNAPVMMFIHGGAWREERAADYALYAEPYVKAGAHFASIDFANVEDTKGSLAVLADQCRRAAAWIARNARAFGGDPDRLYLSARSSGSHLAGCVLTTDWVGQGLPADLVKGAVLGSGMYDLRPVRLSSRSRYLAITDDDEAQLSPARHVDRINTPLTLGIGTLESPEYVRQSHAFAEALQGAGKPVELFVCEGCNHYEASETLGHPYLMLGRRAMRMMSLDV